MPRLAATRCLRRRQPVRSSAGLQGAARVCCWKRPRLRMLRARPCSTAAPSAPGFQPAAVRVLGDSSRALHSLGAAAERLASTAAERLASAAATAGPDLVKATPREAVGVAAVQPLPLPAVAVLPAGPVPSASAAVLATPMPPHRVIPGLAPRLRPCPKPCPMPCLLAAPAVVAATTMLQHMARPGMVPCLMPCPMPCLLAVPAVARWTTTSPKATLPPRPSASLES